jgi:hypothetical protein
MEDQVRSILERPFPEEVLKQRQGPNGTKLTYAEIQVYVDRLNEAFHGAWSWELVSRQQVEDQLVVEGRLTAAGITKTGVGGTAITRRRDNGQMVSFADDIKTAEADAIKRACRLLGLGRDLYCATDGEVGAGTGTRVAPPRIVAAPQQASVPTSTTTTATDASRTRLTSKQFSAIQALARSRGYDHRALGELVKREHGVAPAFLTRAQASAVISALQAKANGHGLREAG